MNINLLKGYPLIRNKKTATEQIYEEINNAQNTLDLVESGWIDRFNARYVWAVITLRKTWNSFIENPYNPWVKEKVKHDLCIAKIHSPIETCRDVAIIDIWITNIEAYISGDIHIQNLIISRIMKQMEVISPYTLDTARIYTEQAKSLFPDDQVFIDRLNKIWTSDTQSKALVTSIRKLAESKIGR